MKITILANFYNESKRIGNFLNSLERQSDKDFELILIDDFSTDSSCYKVENFDSSFEIKLLKSKKKGITYAKKTGIKSVKKGIIVFLDIDELIGIDHIKNIRDFFIKNKSYFAVGKIIPIDNGYISQALSNIVELSWQTSTNLKSGNMIIDVEKLRKVGGIKIGSINEDSELSKRLYTQGYTINKIENITVKHDYKNSILWLLKREYSYGYKDGSSGENIQYKRFISIFILLFPLYYIYILFLFFKNNINNQRIYFSALLLFLLIFISQVGFMSGKFHYHLKKN